MGPLRFSCAGARLLDEGRDPLPKPSGRVLRCGADALVVSLGVTEGGLRLLGTPGLETLLN